MTAAWMRKQLDALMGTDRDQIGASSRKNYTDDDVCKMYICGLCPNEIFTNTKMARGECQFLHAPFLKAEYENRKPDQVSYDDEFEVELQDLVDDCDQKAKIQLKKLAEREQDVVDLPSELDEEAKMINDLYAQAEKLGEEGDVTGSMELFKKADTLKMMKQQKQKPESGALDSSFDNKPKLRVCEVCSSLLGTSDTDRRVVDHFVGRLHVGYAQIREKLQEVKDFRKKRGLPPPDVREIRRRIRERMDNFDRNKDSRRDNERRQNERENRSHERSERSERGSDRNDRREDRYRERHRDSRDRHRHDDRDRRNFKKY